MGASEVADQAASADPAIALRAVHALRALVDELEQLQVDAARDAGWTWQQIAEALNVTRQAVHQKHNGRQVARTPRGESDV